ncbi:MULTISPECIES: hypothetical protein [unclassified Myroides]|uniref:hypothetical protein n=1 Tax=unclassified Myroides TaxID=2642485 RepID=UPI003D2F9A30
MIKSLLTHVMLLFSLCCLVTSCSSSRVSYIKTSTYDQKEEVTTYTLSPLGTVKIPGQWEQTSYNSSSKQQFFTNRDNSATIALTFAPFTSYEFNKEGTLKGYDFTKAFYEWDSSYMKKTFNAEVTILEEDVDENYMIWQVDLKEEEIKTYFLFGEKNGVVRNFSVTKSNWTKSEVVVFLKELYLSK